VNNTDNGNDGKKDQNITKPDNTTHNIPANNTFPNNTQTPDVTPNKTTNNDTQPNNSTTTQPNNTNDNSSEISTNDNSNLISNNFLPPKKEMKFEPVEIVAALTPAGKAALLHTTDTEYDKLLAHGFESPTVSTQIIKNYPTEVTTPNVSVGYKWAPPVQGDANLWQNVELHRYGNNLMESHQYLTPAKFAVNQFGQTVAHAPQDSGIRMITRVPQIQSINFLDTNLLTNEEEIDSEN